MTKQRPNIFEYQNYREYLKDLVGFLKKTQRAFSFRFFSKEAGFASPNFLKLVMDGKRNLSQESVPHFIKGFKLNKAEGDFLSYLVDFNQAVSNEQKNRAYAKMQLSGRYRKIRYLDTQHFEYYSHWYIVAIRELVGTSGFKDDPVWIADQLQPKIRPAQAKKALETLLTLGLIERDENKKLKLTNPTVSSGAEVKSLATANFHRQMLALAIEAQDKIAAPIRDISALMVPIPTSKVPEVKQRVAKFRQELLTWLEGEEKAKGPVYYFGFQLFPITKTEEES